MTYTWLEHTDRLLAMLAVLPGKLPATVVCAEGAAAGAEAGAQGRQA
jgi:hypothetical protein